MESNSIGTTWPKISLGVPADAAIFRTALGSKNVDHNGTDSEGSGAATHPREKLEHCATTRGDNSWTPRGVADGSDLGDSTPTTISPSSVTRASPCGSPCSGTKAISAPRMSGSKISIGSVIPCLAAADGSTMARNTGTISLQINELETADAGVLGSLNGE